jgi:hypothetical protein
MPALLKSRSVWIACLAGWLALALFVLTRDLVVMIGPQAPGLQRDELAAFAFCMGDVLLDAVFDFLARIPHQPLIGELYNQVFINVFSYAAVACAGYAVIYARALASNRIRSAELERRLAEARLEALTRRLQPHFIGHCTYSLNDGQTEQKSYSKYLTVWVRTAAGWRFLMDGGNGRPAP